jgi:hypothetical protein
MTIRKANATVQKPEPGRRAAIVLTRPSCRHRPRGRCLSRTSSRRTRDTRQRSRCPPPDRTGRGVSCRGCGGQSPRPRARIDTISPPAARTIWAVVAAGSTATSQPTLAGERQGGGPSHAPASARDDADFSCQPAGHFSGRPEPVRRAAPSGGIHSPCTQAGRRTGESSSPDPGDSPSASGLASQASREQPHLSGTLYC